jgi:hypothetical protein
MIGIRDLKVLKELIVHQLTIEPKRVKATYTVIHENGEEFHNEIIYSYDISTFDPTDPADINLASMMVVQVALNYSLFFERIVFDGLFDQIDERFLMDMMENTSREILVMKFLSENEFLKKPFDEVGAEKLKRYSNSELVFKNSIFKGLSVKNERTNVLRDHYAILSSGGKDSLLTYGMVKELGEAHPIFINESGRHWFTAVNAHRHFRSIEENTRKPWTNSDRIFNWMVRQLPFIKDNFQNIRADIYPIRMWTVAVFLFGVLPIVRKLRIGNVLIGNEYDTTYRGNHHGISHYNGLYDQSKYFDNVLSRYYQRKGWQIHQYSILRSLSELLILKVLVKRYPDLQKHQVSCHAAHEKDGTMLPCGNCEKCRRIIGMLKALDEDPKRCGYTDEQIARGLHALAVKNVKQIGSDAAHLYYLLLEKGLIQNNIHTRKLAKPHYEIMKLRFDNERSRLSDIPEQVRSKTLDILQEYADGITKRVDNKWIPLKKRDLDLKSPYLIKSEQNE